MITKAWAEQPPGLYGAAAAFVLLVLLIVTGQQLLWLPLCALLASLALAWLWPHWALATLRLEAHSLTPLRQGETARWRIDLCSQLPLWGLNISGPLGLFSNEFIPGRKAQLLLSTQPLMAGRQDASWRCSVHYPFNLWHQTLTLQAEDLAILPGLEPIDYLPLTESEPGQVRKALVCFDSSAAFGLGDDVHHSHGVELKVLANLCRALAAKGYEVNLATSLGLITAPPYSGGFTPLDETLLQALKQPVSGLDLLARYNTRPDAHLVIVPQLLSSAVAPELFPGQILWQLLFDEERFLHPLSRGRHFHRKRAATHWQWVIEPQQPLARLFYVY